MPNHFHLVLEATAPNLIGRKNSANVRETAEARTERLGLAGLQALTLRPTDLATRPKGDKRKAKLALAIQRATTMALSWIATRLCLRSAGCFRQTPGLMVEFGISAKLQYNLRSSMSILAMRRRMDL